MNFNINPPEFIGGNTLTDSMTKTSIADANGNLLFSVGYNQIYDRNNNPMLNGDSIFLTYFDVDYYRSAIIPSPANSNQYYVITLSPFDFWGQSAYCKAAYSIIDMSLNNGLGDVLQGQKAILIGTPNLHFEPLSLQVSSGTNCDGYWILLHGTPSKNYYAFSLTANGINPNPVISQGLQTDSFAIWFGGQITYNNIAARVVRIQRNNYTNSYEKRFIETAQFNKATGQFFNFKCIFTNTINSSNNFINGQRFWNPLLSPDGSKLYCVKDTYYVSSILPSFVGLKQFDLSLLPDTLAVQNSEYLVDKNSGPMRIGPDGKIYVNHYSTSSSYRNLAIIHHPNNYGAACGFDSIGISIPSNVIAAFPDTNYIDFAELGDNIVLNLPTDTVFNNFYIDTNICPSNTFVLHADSSYRSPLWNGNWFPVKYSDTIHQSGTYWVLGIKNCTYYMDSFHVNFHLDTVQHEPENISLCHDSTVILHPNLSFEHYYWSNGSSDSFITVNTPGIYTLTGTINCTTTVHSYNVTYLNLDIDLGNDTVICPQDSLLISLPANAAITYQWQDGTASNQYVIREKGTYTIRALYNGCPFYDSIKVSILEPQLIVTPPDTTICIGDKLIIEATATPVGSFIWQPNGEQTASIVISQQGNYIVSATNICGTLQDSVYVTTKDCPCIVLAPNAFSPNGDGKNDLYKPEMECRSIHDYQLSIYNRWGQKIFFAADVSKAWDGTFNNKPCDVGSYFFYLHYKDEHGSETIKKGGIALIR